MRSRDRRYRRLIILVIIVLPFLLLRSASAQEIDYWVEARELLASMTPEERIGQLFLVTFVGSTASEDVSELILDYHIGGVALRSRNDNFTNLQDPKQQVADLVNSLQELSLLGYKTSDDSNEQPIEDTNNNQDIQLEETIDIPVPLLIATVHEGDGPPYTEMESGFTELPSPMAIGATWQQELSKAIGEIAGRELSAVGINMLIGPSLDVLESPRPTSLSDLGSRTFGGDPYWVGQLGQAYISGVHLGSDERIAVIANHFPGYGSSDRPINQEVGTVRKSLEQLKQIELAPFFQVTNLNSDLSGIADGLLTAHVRYQGFQGNIRSTTAPVSFDPNALMTLMELPQFSDWRENGGLIVSDELGVRAVERFYDATGQEFPHRQVAKDALLAGNDLLYVSSFSLEGEGYDRHLANIKDTILWFRERYETDQTFQQRIDEAALRIIHLKLKLYGGNFEASNVLVDTTKLSDIDKPGESTVFNLAQEAITLISPSQSELDTLLPVELNDRIVIFTDVRQSQQCTTCPSVPWLNTSSLEDRMLALYGPDATDQVQSGQITSFSFDQLKEFLASSPQESATPTPSSTNTSTEEPKSTDDETNFGESTPAVIETATISPGQQVQLALQNANWIIFAALNPDPNVPGSDALKLFLRERPDIAAGANVIVFAYNAPYYLDTTEISQLSAYFGVYSKIDSFIDASVRALFQESSLRGKSPVSIDGVRYDLFEVTRPDPSQVIELFILDEDTPTSPPSEAPLEVMPGATLRLQTGVIVDHNGNPVPDGTTVQFVQQDRIQGFTNVIGEQLTTNGIANLDYLLEARTGNFRITAISGNANTSEEIDIVIGENAEVSVNTPTPIPTVPPTSTPVPTETSTPTPTPSPTPTTVPSPTPTSLPYPEEGDGPIATLVNDGQMLLGFGIGLLLAGGTAYAIGRNDSGGMSGLIRCVLSGLIGALIAYNYFALGLPGSNWLADLGAWAALITTLFGGFIGLLLYISERRLTN